MSLTGPITWGTGFECGLASIVTNGGGLANTISGTPAIVSDVKRSGDYCLKLDATGAACYLYKNLPSARYIVASIEFRVESLGSALRFYSINNGVYIDLFVNTDGTLRWYTASYGGAWSADTVNAGEFFRIDFLADGINSTIDWVLKKLKIAPSPSAIFYSPIFGNFDFI